jgi:hypothetical protein
MILSASIFMKFVFAAARISASSHQNKDAIGCPIIFKSGKLHETRWAGPWTN